MRNCNNEFLSCGSLCARWSLFWLVLANLVGLWLASTLLFPWLHGLAGEFSYGRVMPLHMDWHLYGWCSLPLVGVLVRYFVPEHVQGRRYVNTALVLWTLSLLLLGVQCLMGESSGKLFLNWSGLSRVLFPTSLLFLWSVLVYYELARYRNGTMSAVRMLVGGVVLTVLLSVPVSLFIASSPDVYPAINPDSGGATGHSLLISTLGIIALYGVLPVVLGLKQMSLGMSARVFWGAWTVSILIWAFIEHGDASHHHINQMLGLGLLVLWIPLSNLFLLSYNWPVVSRAWLRVFCWWWCFLVFSGLFTFMPGVSEVWKFTNALVAHAHLAMAGAVSALFFAVLGVLDKADDCAPYGGKFAFWLWNAGVLVHVLVLLIQGTREGLEPTVLFLPNTATNIAYMIRWAAGLTMFTASVMMFTNRMGYRVSLSRKNSLLLFVLLLGAGDMVTGVLLFVAPGFIAALLGGPSLEGSLVFLRYVGLFVFAVGGMYVWAWRALRCADGKSFRIVLEITAWVRGVIAVGVLCLVFQGELSPVWFLICCYDGMSSVIQIVIVRKKV